MEKEQKLILLFQNQNQLLRSSEPINHSSTLVFVNDILQQLSADL